MVKPRLLILASTYPASVGDGTPSFVRDLAVRMADAFDVEVLVPAVPGGARHETDDGIRVTRFRYFWRRWEDVAHGAILENVRARRSRILQLPALVLFEYLAVRRAVRRLRPDVVHAHWILPQGLVATWAARRVPLVVTTLGGDLYALRSRLGRRLKRRVVRSARVVTVMNTDMRARVLDLGGDVDDVRVMPMGADLASFESPALRESGGALRLLLVGRLVEKKGFAVALAAVRERPPAGAWELTVVGDGPLRGELEALASGMPVSFVGQRTRDALARDLAEADVVAFPSVRASSGDQDGLPVTLLEAMGSGCAVVVSDLPGLNEAVEDGVSGLVVPPGEPRALAEAVATLAADPGRRRELGAAAAARARRYDVSEVARAYRALLLDVAAD